MAEFTAFERFIAGVLARFPGFKREAKFWFQKANFLLSTRQESRWQGNLTKISTRPGESFFGYYDKSPESADANYVLYHAYPQSVRGTQPKIVDIMMLDRREGTSRRMGSTAAFNFQIGSRLHWLDEQRFIYNSYNEKSDRYESVICNAINSESHILSIPVFDTNGTQALSIDFKRLAGLGIEYGYFAHRSNADPDAACIVLTDLESGKSGGILYPDQLLQGLEQRLTQGHYVNHLMISPGGRNVIFIHRWKENGKIRHRLLCMDMQGRNLNVLNDGMTSHCCWLNDSTVVGYMEVSGQKGYFSIDLPTGNISPAFGTDPPVSGDGHPSAYKDILIFDTYPDRARMQHLYKYEHEKFVRLGAFRSPLQKDPSLRCDLHPRIVSGRRIYLDSCHEGSRQLYLLETVE